jgi:hypothetical protein
LHSHWVAGGKKGCKPRCEQGPNLRCKECVRQSKKCSFMPAKAKVLKQGAEDNEGPKWAPRQRRVASPDPKGSPSRTDGGEVGKGDNVQSMTVEDLTARVEALLKCTEEMWGNDPSPELAQCAILMHWAASGASAMVEEGNLSKLEVVVAVGKTHIVSVRILRISATAHDVEP